PFPHFAVGHPPASEEGVDAGGHLLRPRSAALVVGEPGEREQGVVARGHDEDAEPRPPDLDERRILPGRRPGPFDARVDREERRPRHAVLQSRPGRFPKGTCAAWEALVERSDALPEGENLRACELERRPWHRARRYVLAAREA